MELRPGYKQTEIGVVPDDWDASSLGEHATFRTGPFGSALHKSDYVKDGVPVVNPMHIIDGEIFPSETMTVTESAAQSLAEFRLRRDEIVIGRRGDMGRCAVVQPHQSGWLCGTGSMIVRPTGFDPHFLQRVLSSDAVISAIENNSVGTTMVNLNQGSLSSLKIQHPPRVEQSAIATALGDVDALLAAQDALIAKKRAIKQGAMQELLTGKRRLPGFSGEWEVKSLKSLLESPVTDGPHLTPKFLDRGIPFLSVNNLIDGKIDWSDLRYISEADHREFSRKCRPQIGDVLFGKAASVGRVAFVDTSLEFNIWSPIALIRIAQDFSAKFVYRQLQSQFVERQVLLLTNSSSQGNIGMGDIERLDINLPSSRDEQGAISDALDDMDAEISTLETKRAKTAQLKQGMMQALLTGRIRLV